MHTRDQMINDIILSCKASNMTDQRNPTNIKTKVPLDEILLGLCFRTESELRKICQELNIKWSSST